MSSFLFPFIFLFMPVAPAAPVVPPVCGLPVGACAPSPCDYRIQTPGVFTIVSLTAIPTLISSPPDACDPLATVFNLNNLPSLGAMPAWMIAPPVVTGLPAVNKTFSYNQWIVQNSAGGMCWSMNDNLRIDTGLGIWDSAQCAAPIVGACAVLGAPIAGQKCLNTTTGFMAVPPGAHSTCKLVTDGKCNTLAGGPPGACGPLAGTVGAMPAGPGLCASGVASPVIGGDPWNWTCSGSTDASCSASTGPNCDIDCFSVFVWASGTNGGPGTTDTCTAGGMPMGKFSIICSPHNGATCSYVPAISVFMAQPVTATCGPPAGPLCIAFRVTNFVPGGEVDFPPGFTFPAGGWPNNSLPAGKDVISCVGVGGATCSVPPPDMSGVPMQATCF